MELYRNTSLGEVSKRNQSWRLSWKMGHPHVSSQKVRTEHHGRWNVSVWGPSGSRLASIVADQKPLAQNIVICMSELCKSDRSWRVRTSSWVWANIWWTVLQIWEPGRFRVGRRAGGTPTQQKGRETEGVKATSLIYVVFLLQKRQSENLCTI